MRAVPRAAVPVLTALAALAAGLVAGVHLAGAGALNPAMRSLDAPTFVTVKHLLDGAFPPLMRPLLLTSLALAALATAAAAVARQPRAAAAAGVALLAGLVVLVAILRGDLPLNEQMARWDPSAPPPGWQSVREAWERWFTVRTVASLTAFAAAFAAARGGQPRHAGISASRGRPSSARSGPGPPCGCARRRG